MFALGLRDGPSISGTGLIESSPGGKLVSEFIAFDKDILFLEESISHKIVCALSREFERLIGLTEKNKNSKGIRFYQYETYTIDKFGPDKNLPELDLYLLCFNTFLKKEVGAYYFYINSKTYNEIYFTCRAILDGKTKIADIKSEITYQLILNQLIDLDLKPLYKMQVLFKR
jgi:hypothetical protein